MLWRGLMGWEGSPVGEEGRWGSGKGKMWVGSRLERGRGLYNGRGGCIVCGSCCLERHCPQGGGRDEVRSGNERGIKGKQWFGGR
jgi:hypothetical protein